MNRIEQRFQQLRARAAKGFIVYIGAGDPDLETTRRLARALDRAGVDVLELGVPFSDPLADGLINQLAAQRGLESGTTPRGVLETVAAIRAVSEIPIVLYVYFNLLHRYGLERFIQEAAQAGVDGLLVLDLPPEEGQGYEALVRAAGLCAIYLVAPTTPPERVAAIVRHASGFVYCVSREGVTGMRDRVADHVADLCAGIRRHTALPVAVGFGISTAAHVREVARHADAVVVGSAIVNQIAARGREPDLIETVAGCVTSLMAGLNRPEVARPA
jgi:tryptophan synthase alpha chain